ncbi:uncharacterized protein HMPREF1541_11067 [Cyphellophora europaea CBS 101466]|uniref:Major facilitator superfamily (MFS) profile domain-containing protein n=1 Tax=Cyphellophora europaea (strain CBS 101466) TaxID=1220924 RepID=W2S5G5_CYPE1|nr:uncharacterized protein HMPREF1541_11067 [Cyphellophora europaea CBS 101466]ETN43936.1 hypothetical protein HMPREF1541_11067 [Cyphellophora europaea CBS 101466]
MHEGEIASAVGSSSLSDNEEAGVPQAGGGEGEEELGLPKSRWYHSTLFNIILVGAISFTQPGIWAALNSTGAGGQQEPYLVNGANALIFGIMTFGCPLFGVLANKFGLKPMLIIGTLGLAPYSAALYVNNRYGVAWYVLVGAVTCGISGAALWTTESAVAVGYAPPHQRGMYVAIWLGLREFGQIIGASIQLGLNHRLGQLGKVTYGTYLALIGIQCVGLPLALLFTSPHKAIRPDGRVVAVANSGGMGSQSFRLKDCWAVLRQRWVWMLIPVAMCFQWNNTYGSIYLTRYFSVRARTLASLVAGVAVTVADFLTGWFLDLKCFTRPAKAKIIIIGFSIALALGLFPWQLTNEYDYSSAESVTIDWSSTGFGRAFAVHIFFRFFNEAHIVFIFWLVGAFTRNAQTVTLACGLINGFEALGSTLANGIGAARIAPVANLWVAFGVFLCSVPPTIMVAWMVPRQPKGTDPAEALDAKG